MAGFPSPDTAGTAATVTVTAKVAYGNTATGYTGTIKLTSSDGQVSLPANYSFTSTDAGVHTFSNGVTFKTAGTQSLTATDTSTASITGSQTGITVNAAAVNHLNVAAPTGATKGTAFNVTVTAQDVYNNTVTSFRDKVHFTSSDPIATLPKDYTFKTTDHGVHTFSVTLNTVGSETITVTDSAHGSITGTATVSVAAAPVPAGATAGGAPMASASAVTVSPTASAANQSSVVSGQPASTATGVSNSGQAAGSMSVQPSSVTTTDATAAQTGPDYLSSVNDLGGGLDGSAP